MFKSFDTWTNWADKVLHLLLPESISVRKKRLIVIVLLSLFVSFKFYSNYNLYVLDEKQKELIRYNEMVSNIKISDTDINTIHNTLYKRFSEYIDIERYSDRIVVSYKLDENTDEILSFIIRKNYLLTEASTLCVDSVCNVVVVIATNK